MDHAASSSRGIDLTQLRGVFFEEANEHLEAMETLLVRFDPSRATDEELNAIFRAAHSIKGGAATFGCRDIAEVTHLLESLLDRARRREIVLDAGMVDTLLAARDLLVRQVGGHRDGHPLDAAAVAAMCERVRQHVEHEVGMAQSGAASGTTGIFDGAPGSDPGFGIFDGAPGSNPGFGFFDGAPGSDPGFGFFEDLPVPPAVTAATVSAEAAAAAAAGPQRMAERAAGSVETSIRVAVEKVDALINLVGELVITQAMLTQNAATLDPVQDERLLQGLTQLDRNTRALQEAVMSVRMTPIAIVFNRFPRVVRDLAARLSKQVRLEMEGEATELDKGLIERLVDPLTHLVRNSLDHGIEIPEQRAAQGKPEAGTIRLRAFHRGGTIVIEVSDDGAGLDRNRILAKARERGVAAPDSMTDAEVWSLIFEAGFSTATEVTDVSGRGVGMDVVRRNVSGMGGNIDIQSVAGAGTTIAIRLPLTLAIMDGMSVAVGSETYILPLASVVESLQVADGQIKSVANRGLVAHVRGEYLPVISMHELFPSGGARGERASGIMVIVEVDKKKAALLVDELLGQHQVVVKSLDRNYRRVRGVSGATIMGDGRVAIILDVAALARPRLS